MKLRGALGAWILGWFSRTLGRAIKKEIGTVKVTKVKVIR